MTSRRTAVAAFESVENRRLFAAPAVDAIPSYAVPVGKTIQIPLTSTSTSRVTFTPRDGSASVVEAVHTGNTFIQMQVAGYSQPMVFELFNDVAPDTVRRITGLINSGFYNGLTFHRIINNFVIQGGDPNGDGTGGQDATFDDEFNANTIFSGTGQLALANSGKDTNSSQFFITEGPQRLLDFNHTIFGQLVRGEATRDAISNVATDSNDAPTSPVTITRVRVIRDYTDAVLVVSAKAAGSYRIKVTATNADGSTSQSFDVTAAADTVDDPPILNTANLSPVYYTTAGQAVTIPLSSTDIEGTGANIFTAQFVSNPSNATGTFGSDRKSIVVTPTADGVITLKVGVVSSSSAQSRGSTNITSGDTSGISISDSQLITVAVGDVPLTGATGYDFDATAGAPTAGINVASFRDTDAHDKGSSFTAKIDWGDGNVTTGTVKNSGSRYYVYGDKTYGAAVAGSEPVTVTVTDAGGASTRVTSTATVRNIASVVDGVLSVYGGSGRDRIGIARKGHTYSVTVNRITRSFSTASIASILLEGFDGNDALGLDSRVGIPAVIAGDGGNDVIVGGAGVNRVDGGDGNDLITGGASRDFLSGGAGDDTISGGLGNDNLYGNAGRDLLNGNAGRDAIDGGAGADTARSDARDTDVSIESLIG